MPKNLDENNIQKDPQLQWGIYAVSYYLLKIGQVIQLEVPEQSIAAIKHLTLSNTLCSEYRVPEGNREWYSRAWKGSIAAIDT